MSRTRVLTCPRCGKKLWWTVPGKSLECRGAVTHNVTEAGYSVEAKKPCGWQGPVEAAAFKYKND